MRNTNSRVYESLDLWRGFAALWVVLFHSFSSIQHDAGRSLAVNPLALLVSWGDTGVALFFVISGFLITSLLLKEDVTYGNINLPLFYIRRILRIWPAYFSVILFACFLVPLLHAGEAHHFGAYFYHASLMFLPYAFFVSNMAQIISPLCTSHGVIDPFQIDAMAAYWRATGVNEDLILRLLGPTWSLCLEEQFYLVWPLCLSFLKTPRKRVNTLFQLIAGSFALRLFLQIYFAKSGHLIWYLNTFAHLDPLMIGALLGTFNHYHRANLEKICLSQGWIILVLSLSVLAATMYSLPDIGMNRLWMTPALTWCALALAGLLACTCYWPPCQNLFSNKIIAGFGKKTYAMYLLHYYCLYQVLTLTKHFAESWSTWAIRGVLALVYAYLLALISWTILEGPLNKLKSKFARSSQSPPPAVPNKTSV